MPLVTNDATTQKPMSAAGVTGAQSIKLIQAPRIFMKSTPDSTTGATVPNTKYAGNAANLVGWTDLGSVAGNAKIGYEKKIKEVKTGIDNYLRAAYSNEKTGNIEFSLNQLDDVVMSKIPGLSASVQTAGSIYTFHLGQEDLVQMALLVVAVNKLDGKEHQFYSPSVYMNFTFAEDADAMVLKCSAILPFFTVTGQTSEDILAHTIFK